MTNELNIIIQSPLMYIIVGVVLTYFTEWRIRKFIRSLFSNKEIREVIKEVIKEQLKSKGSDEE